MTRVITARLPGPCSRCPRVIVPGDRVSQDAFGWHHASDPAPGHQPAPGHHPAADHHVCRTPGPPPLPGALIQVAGELRCVTRTRALTTAGSSVSLTETRQATPEETQAHARLTELDEQHDEQQRRLTASQDAWLGANLRGDGLRLTHRPPGLSTASDPAGTAFPGQTPQGRAFTVRLTHGLHAYADDVAALAELAFHDVGGETISPYAALGVLLDATDEHAAGHRAARLVVRHTTEAWLETRTADIHLPLYDARDHALAAEADRRGLNPHRLRPAGFLRDPAVYRPHGLRPYTPTFTETGSDRLLAQVDGEFRVLKNTRAAGSAAGDPAARGPEQP